MSQDPQNNDLHHNDPHHNDLQTVSDPDDVWGSDDEHQLTTADLKRNHIKQGYLDGLSNAKESSLQQGFDDGFPKGASLGILVGTILSTVRSYDERLFDECKEELNITKVLKKEYFDENLDLSNKENHAVLRKWQNIVKEISENQTPINHR